MRLPFPAIRRRVVRALTPDWLVWCVSGVDTMDVNTWPEDYDAVLPMSDDEAKVVRRALLLLVAETPFAVDREVATLLAERVLDAPA